MSLEKQNLEDKQNKLLNLVLDGTIDKEMYASRKDELNKKIKKIDKQQEELSREVEDDAIMNSGRNKIKAFFEKEDLRLEEFDEEIFETLVHKAIIGEVKDNGEVTEVVMYNTPESTEIIVPPTGLDSSSIAYIIGGLIIAIGSVLIYRNAKKQN